MALKISVPWAVRGDGDAFIGWVRKALGHTPFPFVATDIYVVNSEGQILLLHRSDDAHWCPPTGVVDPLESPQEGAIRELNEETGLIAKESDLHLFYTEGGEKGYHKYPNGDEAIFTRIVFVIKRDLGSEIKLNYESTEFAWFALDDLPDNCSDSVYRVTPILSACWRDIPSRN